MLLGVPGSWCCIAVVAVLAGLRHPVLLSSFSKGAILSS